MKKLTFSFLLLVLLISCNSNEPLITPEEREKALKEGRAHSIIVLQNLMQKLMQALQKDSAYALNFCSEEAMNITHEIENNNLPSGVKVKRIAKKNRNLNNSPTNREKAVYNYFEDSMEEGKIVEERIAKVTENNKTHFEYYRPILTARICLTCHGNPEKMDSKIKEILAQKYPDDKATGFKEGQLRGLLKISFPADNNK